MRLNFILHCSLITVFLAFSFSARAEFNPTNFYDFEKVLGGNIPFPPQDFEQALLRLDPHSDISATVIPHGRSLERRLTDFSQPRSIFAWRTDVTSSPFLLFVAYTPRTQELEIISWNRKLRQFDFKLVQNYASGLKPKIVNANRALCMACHQNGTPIFPIAPWGETTNNRDVLENLKRENTDSFASYWLNLDHGPFHRDQVQVENLDFRVRSADTILQNQQMVQQGCGTDLQCRKNLADPAFSKSLGEQLKAHWPENQFAFPHGILASRELGSDPLSFNQEQDPLRKRSLIDPVEVAIEDPEFVSRLASAETGPETIQMSPPLKITQSISSNHGSLFLKYCQSCHLDSSQRPPLLPLFDTHALREYQGSAGRRVGDLIDPDHPLMPPLGAMQPTRDERLQMIKQLGYHH